MDIQGRLLIREGQIQNPGALEYTLQRILTDIDKGSKFNTNNKDLIQENLTPEDYLKQLAKRGYDAMLGYDGETVFGHIVYQEHQGGKSWHVFRVKVQEEFVAKGYALPFVISFIEKARNYGVDEIKLGNEETKNEKMVKLLRILERRECELHLRVNRESHLVVMGL